MNSTIEKQKTLRERFDERWALNAATGCWQWTGAMFNTGYGSMKFRGSNPMGAHRIAWQVYRGPIPEGMHVHHVCENEACVNPDHLELLDPGTHKRLHTSKITHCPHGHEYDDANTGHKAGGWRRCRTCDRLYARRARQETR